MVENQPLRHEFAQMDSHAREAGFEIEIALVYLDSPQLCMSAFPARFLAEGIMFPTKTLRRYSDRILFWNHYKGLATDGNFIINTGNGVVP